MLNKTTLLKSLCNLSMLNSKTDLDDKNPPKNKHGVDYKLSYVWYTTLTELSVQLPSGMCRSELQIQTFQARELSYNTYLTSSAICIFRRCRMIATAILLNSSNCCAIV